jgi:hypothetical protein
LLRKRDITGNIATRVAARRRVVRRLGVFAEISRAPPTDATRG